MEKKHFTKNWIISITEFKNDIGRKYNVTRRIPDLGLSNTKVFRNKKSAIKQFNDWLK